MYSSPELNSGQFCIKYVCSSKYPEFKKLGTKLCSMYVYKAAFLKKERIKNNSSSWFRQSSIIE